MNSKKKVLAICTALAALIIAIIAIVVVSTKGKNKVTPVSSVEAKVEDTTSQSLADEAEEIKDTSDEPAAIASTEEVTEPESKEDDSSEVFDPTKIDNEAILSAYEKVDDFYVLKLEDSGFETFDNKEGGYYNLPIVSGSYKFILGDFKLQLDVTEFYEYAYGYTLSFLDENNQVNYVYEDGQFIDSQISLRPFGEYLLFFNGFRTDINSSDIHMVDKKGNLVFDTLNDLPKRMRYIECEYTEDSIIFTARRYTHGPSVMLPGNDDDPYPEWDEYYDFDPEKSLEDTCKELGITKDYATKAIYTLRLNADKTLLGIEETEVLETFEDAFEEAKNLERN